MTDLEASQIIVYLVSGIILARFFAAPYLVWKDDQAIILGLEEELQKPDNAQRQKLAEHFAQKRATLADLMGEITSLSQRHIPSSSNRPSGVIHAQTSEAESILTLFSDETHMVQLCRDQIQLAAIVIECKDNHEPYRKDLETMLENNRELAPLLRGIKKS